MMRSCSVLARGAAVAAAAAVSSSATVPGTRHNALTVAPTWSGLMPSRGVFTRTRALYAPNARTAAAAASRALGITKAPTKTRTHKGATAARLAMTVDPGGVRTARSGASRLVTPPQAADTVDEDDNEALAGALHTNRVGTAEGLGEEDTALDATSSPAATPSTLLNPFKGLHAHLSRSYRLDQLVSVAAPNDVLLARQEKKSTAFSFLRFASGAPFYQDHWDSLPGLRDDCARHELINAQVRSSSRLARHRNDMSGGGGVAVPGYTLFNNQLGLDDPRVQSSFPLLVAQRLLLFSDSFRHFHALCGRENVPCDFYADIDLPDARTAAEGEQVLLEVLNYLEVRLPGVGFTDPFFLVLANEQMQSGQSNKIGYHIHARSMTYTQDRLAMSLNDASKSLKERRGGADDDDLTATHDDDGNVDDDLSDLVNVVDGTGGKSAKTGSSATRLVAFHDYRTVKLLADEVNQTVGRTVIDEGCYRANGMLRCAFSGKLKSRSDTDAAASGVSSAAQGGLLLPLTRAKDKALQKKLGAMEEVLRTMTDPEILELSFCTRHLDTVETAKVVHQHLKSTLPPARSLSKQERLEHEDILKAATRHRFKLVRPRHVLGPQSAQSVEYDMYGNLVSPFLTEGAKWRRYKSVIAKLNDVPSTCATSYDIWVRIGLALHNFSNEDHVFEEWVKFSLRCPQKYSRESCRRKWVQFERNPDAQNWRRGFNYLNSTIWRQI